MIFRVVCGLDVRPGMSENSDSDSVGILVDQNIVASSLAIAKREAMLLASSNPVMFTAIRDQGTYHAPWLQEAETKDGYSFWSRLFPFYGPSVAYIHVVELPEEFVDPQDIADEITEEWERDYRFLPKRLRILYRESSVKRGYTVLPESAGEYFIKDED